MTTNAPNRRMRRWPWIVGGIVVLVAIAVGVVLIFGQRTAGEQPESSPTSSTGPTSVDGCLGGSGRNAGMVETAQSEASRSAEGAVSYAASFGRYLYQFPWPADANEVAATTSVSDATWTDWQRFANEWTGPTPMQTTTINGRYFVEQYSADRAAVTIVLPWVIDGAISPSRNFGPTVQLDWIDNRWTVSGITGERDGDSTLLSTGLPLENGC